MKNEYQYGFVPKRLIVDNRPELSNFPLNILFVSHINKNDEIVAIIALYEPDFSSFKEEIGEDGEEKQVMNYRNKYGPQWRVEIWYHKERKSYIGFKYSGPKNEDSEWKGGACGSQWGPFFSHLTINGLVDEEPCLFQTLDELVYLALANEYIENE